MASFYLHEDDWGMINLLPAENAVWAEGVAQEAQRAAQENFAGFAQIGEAQIPTYNNIYVIPEEKHPISERAIRLEALRALLAGNWPEAERVESGYSSYTEEVGGAFAFGKAYADTGAFYGSHKDGIVTRLNILRPASDDMQVIEPFEAALAHLGTQYNLVLADWWSDMVLDLRDPAGIRRYLAEEP